MKTSKNKEILSDFVKDFREGKEDIMIDILAKRVSASKRYILYLFYILLRYLKIKENPKSQGPIGKVLYIISGRSSHNSKEDKKMI